MLIVLAHNVTKNAEDSEGKSNYDVLIRINERPIWSGRISGHVRKHGAAELLRRIADNMDQTDIK